MTTGRLRRAVELATGGIEQKKRYRQYKARTERLPDSYRTAIDALQRYSYYFGGPAEGGMPMLEDLAGLFEQGAASGIPVREIVGANPVEFADAVLGNHPQGHWIIQERERLTSAIDRATGEDTAKEGVSR
jgi:DNA-binding ferritin-like protein (Dps family)